MNSEAIFEKINGEIKERIQEAATAAPRRINVKVEREQLLSVLTYLKDQFDFTHLATISGVDLGENFEVIYHLSNDIATVNLAHPYTPQRTEDPQRLCRSFPAPFSTNGNCRTCSALVVENIPDPRPLLLADDWPAGQYPLRKDWQFDRPAEVIPGGK